MKRLPTVHGWSMTALPAHVPASVSRIGRANASIVTNGARAGLGVGEFPHERYRSAHRTLPTGAPHRFVPHCAPA